MTTTENFGKRGSVPSEEQLAAQVSAGRFVEEALGLRALAVDGPTLSHGPLGGTSHQVVAAWPANGGDKPHVVIVNIYCDDNTDAEIERFR